MKTDIKTLFLSIFSLDPTPDQAHAIETLAKFLDGKLDTRIFILRGYAGTGKTTLVAALAKTLKKRGRHCVLLAPTGRAAKVLSKHAQHKAETIHRHIYSFDTDQEGEPRFVLKYNSHENAVFIIDESSMISLQQDEKEKEIWVGEGLLPDLFTYVFSGEGNQIIFVGDKAQLPPVKENESVALSSKMLEDKFGYSVQAIDLRHVTRQASKSGPLLNATYVRKFIENKTFEDRLVLELNQHDLDHVTSPNLIKKVKETYTKRGIENVCVVVRTNHTAVRYNQQIRSEIFNYGPDLNVDDRIMIVKNNYLWSVEEKGIGFLANGEMVRVAEIGVQEHIEKFKFQKLSIEIESPYNEKVLLNDVVVMLNVLTTFTPNLPRDDWQELYAIRRKTYPNLSGRMLRDQLRIDPYLNALQIKFGYAITCHKAQGGQWSHVFVNRGRWSDNQNRIDNYRWFYTAITRTTDCLTFINYPTRLIRPDIPTEISSLIEQSQVSIVENEISSDEPQTLIDHQSDDKKHKSEVDDSERRRLSLASTKKGKWFRYGIGMAILAFVILYVILPFFGGNTFDERLTPSPQSQFTSTIVNQGIINPTPSDLPSNTPTVTSTLLSTPTNVILQGCVTVRSLRVRSGPGLEFPVVSGLNYGDCLFIDARTADSIWLRLSTESGDKVLGWVMAEYIANEGDLDSLTIIESMPQ